MGFVRIVGLLVLATGCRQIFGLDSPSGDGGGGPACYGTGLVQVCFSAVPTGDVPLPATIDTGASTLCSTDVTSGGAGLCVVGAQTIEVAAATAVVASGTKPLVLVGVDSITISGRLDASSGRSSHGPAADFTGCNAATTPGSSGGCAGGSFAGTGGHGGDPGRSDAGGVLAAPAMLHGGCPGASGGGGTRGGHGGGAVYLISPAQISVGDQIDASGGGGDGGDGNTRGGGGGGSGGMIGLDAPTIALTGIVFANGGGGGDGAGTTAEGDPGRDPSSGNKASGGSGGSMGGDGGDGGAGTTPDGGAASDGSAGVGGGGGGGGAVGAIKTYGQVQGGGTISPPAS
jgi:hypothetical protein